jgi:putative membrane protein
MGGYLMEWYLWIKAVHIMAVISWMAGLFYLPRLFVYHTQVGAGSEQDLLFQIMEVRLLRVIMNPAMLISLVSGLFLALAPGIVKYLELWFLLKVFLVLFMVAYHMALAKWRRKFSEGTNVKTEGFFRKANEIPTVLMILIVILVVVRPF